VSFHSRLFAQCLVLQVRFAVVEALGFISFRLSKDTFEANIQKLIPTYLAMYKKEKYTDFLPISQVSTGQRASFLPL